MLDNYHKLCFRDNTVTRNQRLINGWQKLETLSLSTVFLFPGTLHTTFYFDCNERETKGL